MGVIASHGGRRTCTHSAYIEPSVSSEVEMRLPWRMSIDSDRDERIESVKPKRHSHPNGEIDLIMPIDAAAQFDGRGAGWKVYRPGSAHHPTVSGGKALVLYLLPEGAIEFTQT